MERPNKILLPKLLRWFAIRHWIGSFESTFPCLVGPQSYIHLWKILLWAISRWFCVILNMFVATEWLIISQAEDGEENAAAFPSQFSLRLMSFYSNDPGVARILIRKRTNLITGWLCGSPVVEAEEIVSDMRKSNADCPIIIHVFTGIGQRLVADCWWRSYWWRSTSLSLCWRDKVTWGSIIGFFSRLHCLIIALLVDYDAILLLSAALLRPRRRRHRQVTQFLKGDMALSSSWTHK